MTNAMADNRRAAVQPRGMCQPFCSTLLNHADFLDSSLTPSAILLGAAALHRPIRAAPGSLWS